MCTMFGCCTGVGSSSMMVKAIKNLPQQQQLLICAATKMIGVRSQDQPSAIALESSPKVSKSPFAKKVSPCLIDMTLMRSSVATWLMLSKVHLCAEANHVLVGSIKLPHCLKHTIQHSMMYLSGVFASVPCERPSQLRNGTWECCSHQGTAQDRTAVQGPQQATPGIA